MDDKKTHTLNIPLDIPVTQTTITVTDEQWDSMVSQMQAKRAEAEKPKVRNGDLRCYNPRWPWICVIGPSCFDKGKQVYSDGTRAAGIAPGPDDHDLGNVFDIIRQGEIVVGMSPDDAKAIIHSLTFLYPTPTGVRNRLVRHLELAVARYENGVRP